VDLSSDTGTHNTLSSTTGASLRRWYGASASALERRCSLWLKWTVERGVLVRTVATVKKVELDAITVTLR
jgi:hypothetical protein